MPIRSSTRRFSRHWPTRPLWRCIQHGCTRRSERYNKLNEYNTQLLLRNEISRMASGGQLDSTMWTQLAQRLAQLVGAEGCVLTLCDETAQDVRLFAVYGLDTLHQLADPESGFGPELEWKVVTRQLAEKRQPLILN